MPNRYKTISTLADENFNGNDVTSPITSIGDLVCQNQILAFPSGGDFGGVPAAFFVFPNLGPVGPIDVRESFLVQDGALRYDSLRIRTQLGVTSLTNLADEVMTLKAGHMIIEVTALAASPTLMQVSVYPEQQPAQNFTVTVDRGAVDVEAVYSGKVRQMEVQITAGATVLRDRKVNLAPFAEVLARDANEFYLRLQSTNANGGSNNGLLNIIIDKVAIGNG